MSLSGDSSGGDSGERLRRGDGELHIVVCSLGEVFHGAALILGFGVVVSLCSGICESCLVLVERPDGDFVVLRISEFGFSSGLVVVVSCGCNLCCGAVDFVFASDSVCSASIP